MMTSHELLDVLFLLLPVGAALGWLLADKLGVSQDMDGLAWCSFGTTLATTVGFLLGWATFVAP